MPVFISRVRMRELLTRASGREDWKRTLLNHPSCSPNDPIAQGTELFACWKWTCLRVILNVCQFPAIPQKFHVKIAYTGHFTYFLRTQAQPFFFILSEKSHYSLKTECIQFKLFLKQEDLPRYN